MPKEVRKRIIREASDYTRSSVIKRGQSPDRLAEFHAKAKQQKLMYQENARIEREKVKTEYLDWNKWKYTYDTHKKNVGELWQRFQIGERAFNIAKEINYPSKFKNEYDLFAKEYNRLLEDKAKELASFNTKVSAYNDFFPNRIPLKELKLPEKLEALEIKASSKPWSTSKSDLIKRLGMLALAALMVDPVRARPILESYRSDLSLGNGDGFPRDLMGNPLVTLSQEASLDASKDVFLRSHTRTHTRHTEQSTLPTEPTILSTEQSTLPTEPMTLSTEQSTLPTEQTAQPTEQPTSTAKPGDRANEERQKLELGLGIGIPVGLASLGSLYYWMRRRAGIKAAQARVDTENPESAAQARVDTENPESASRDPYSPIPIDGGIEPITSPVEKQGGASHDQNNKIATNDYVAQDRVGTLDAADATPDRNDEEGATLEVKWSEVSLIGETAEKYNALVSIANPLIEQTQNFLQGFKGSRKEAISTYIRDSKYEANSIRQGLEFTASLALLDPNINPTDRQNLTKLQERIVTLRDMVNDFCNSQEPKFESPFNNLGETLLLHIKLFEKTKSLGEVSNQINNISAEINNNIPLALEIEENVLDTINFFNSKYGILGTDISTQLETYRTLRLSTTLAKDQIKEYVEQEKRLNTLFEKTNRYWEQAVKLEEQRSKVRELRKELKNYTNLVKSISDKWDIEVDPHSAVDPFSEVIHRYEKRKGSSTSLPFFVIESQGLNLLDNKCADDENKLNEEIKNMHVELMQTERATGGYSYFLKLQRRDDLLIPNQNLVLIQARASETCGIACARMRLADGDPAFATPQGQGKVLAAFQFRSKKLREAEEGNILQGEEPEDVKQVLNNLDPSTTYQTYENSSFDELRNALYPQGNNGTRMPAVITYIYIPNKEIGHAYLVDDIREINGEEYLDVRDPYYGKRECISKDHFIELWQEKGIFTAGVVNRSEERSSSTTGIHR